MSNDSDFQFPPFDDLTQTEGRPRGSLWGFFDRDGKKDQLGTINLLTPSVVRRARDEIQTGAHVQLDWPLHNIAFPGFGRIPLEHKVKDLGPEGFVGYDDTVHLNTQTSSQWDSLKHVSLSGLRSF